MRRIMYKNKDNKK